MPPGDSHEVTITMSVSPEVTAGEILKNKACFWTLEYNRVVCVEKETTVATPPPQLASINLSDVVINEFLPNPTGEDRATKPDGEWVELYNRGSADADVAGWVLYDAIDNHGLPITAANTNTGGTTVPTGGFLVVYRNGDNNFSLNNEGEEIVRLYNGPISGGATLVDSYSYNGSEFNNLTPTPGSANSDSYSGSGNNQVPVNKSFARIPDGSANWVDPIPTPGGPNKLATSENLIINPVLEPAEPEEIAETNNVEEIIETVNQIFADQPVLNQGQSTTPIIIEEQPKAVPEEVILEEAPIVSQSGDAGPTPQPGTAPETTNEPLTVTEN